MSAHLEQDGANVVDIKDSNGQAPSGWRVLFHFMVPSHTPILLLALISTLVSGILVPILAILFGKIFGTFTTYGGGSIDGHTLRENTTVYAIGVVCLGAATWVANGIYCMAWMTFGALQAREVRKRLFQDLLHKQVEWYETHTSGIGALLPRLQTSVSAVLL